MTTFIGKYLNPGEVETLIKTERDERRKKRLNQVRQQAREKASKIVISVKKERDKQLEILSNHLEAEWLKTKQEKVEELGQLFGENLTSVGAAHSNVLKDIIAKEVRDKKIEEDNLKTVARGEAALNEVKIKQVKEAENAIKLDATRKAVRTAENQRAQAISALPIPPPTLPPHSVTRKDESDASPGDKHFQKHHIPPAIQRGAVPAPNDMVKVIKIPATNDLDAHVAAKLDEVKQSAAAQKKKQEKIEQSNKERVRFLKAKSQLQLQQDYNRIMNELNDLVKQEEVSSEPEFLLGLEKENILLKQEQEAIVEELFSRLGLSIDDTAVAKDFSIISRMQHESSRGDTPVVHVITSDTSSSVSRVSESSSDVRTGESLYLKTGTIISDDIDANSSPIEGTTSISEISSKASRWNEMTPVNATVERFPTTGSTVTTDDETILAGHFHYHALDSSKSIPVLPSLDSTDSKVSQGMSPLLPSEYQQNTLEKKLNDGDSIERSMKRPEDSFKLYQPEISLVETGESTYHESVKNSAKREESQVQALSPFEIDVSKHFKVDLKRSQKENGSVMDDDFKRLAFSKLLANKKLASSQNKTKSLDAKSINEFCNVEVEQTNQSRPIDSRIQKSFHKPISQMSTKSEFNVSQERRNSVGSFLNTSVSSTFRFAPSSISGHQMDPSPPRFSAGGPGLTQDALLFGQFSFRPTIVKPHFGKLEPMHDLSTIVEMDTPRSSQHTCWQNSSSLSISNELGSNKLLSTKFAMDEPGITDEPDLTLVGSECSTCSPNRSHIFEITGITPSTDSSIHMSDKNIINEYPSEVQNSNDVKRYKRSTFIRNTKHGDKIEKCTLSGSSSTNGGPSFRELSYFLRDLSSDESSPLDSYSVSIDSSRKDWSSPTLSSSELHSCFSSKLQRLSTLNTPNLDFLSGSSLPSFLTPNSNPSESKSDVPSSHEELVLSGLSRPNFTSGLDLTMENCTDSLMSFVLHEKNAESVHLTPLDTICTDADTLTGASLSESKSSNGNGAAKSYHPRYLSSQSESVSDSMFSFLRHELSADDSSFSGLCESSTSGHTS